MGWMSSARLLDQKLPYFGICLGHQLLARAIGADTVKLKFGHRGGNHPVLDTRSDHVSITAQNHGFVVKTDSLAQRIGLECRARQSERRLGRGFRARVAAGPLGPISPGGQPWPTGQRLLVRSVPRYGERAGCGSIREILRVWRNQERTGARLRPDRHRAGRRVRLRRHPGLPALREEGIRTILVNSNPATIMTDEDVADAVYIEPLTPEVVRRVIQRERPDGLLPTLGGQTGLNLAVAGRGAGHPRALRRPPARHAARVDQDGRGPRAVQGPAGVASASRSSESAIVTSLDEAHAFAEIVPFPLVIRPAFTLGGTGGGIADTAEELDAIVDQRARRQPDPPGAGRALAAGLERDRVRGDAGRQRHLHHDLQHGELRPDGRPHGRQHRGRAIADALRPASTRCCAPRRSRSSARSRSKAAATSSSRSTRTRSSTAVIEVNPRVSRSSALASRRPAIRSPGWRPRSRSASGSTRSSNPSPARPPPPSSRRSTTASSRSRAGRSTSSPRPTARSAPR